MTEFQLRCQLNQLDFHLVGFLFSKIFEEEIKWKFNLRNKQN
jgi:hypothetical protein